MCQEMIKGKRCKRSTEPYCWHHAKAIDTDVKKSIANSNINTPESTDMSPLSQTATEPLMDEKKMQDKHEVGVVEAKCNEPIYSAAESSGQIAQKKGDSDGTASTINTRESVTDTTMCKSQDKTVTTKEYEVNIGTSEPYIFSERWADQITYKGIKPNATTQLLLIIKSDWFRDNEHIRSLVNYYRSKPFAIPVLEFHTYIYVLRKKMHSGFDLPVTISYWNAWNPKAFVITLSQKLLRQTAAGQNPDKYAEWKDKHEPELTKAKAEKCQIKSIKHKIDPVDIENANQEVLEATTQNIPAIFDKRNHCSFKDGIQLAKEGEVTWAQAISFVRSNVAYILGGGSGFFMTKTFDIDGNLDYVRVTQDKMQKSLLQFRLPDQDGNFDSVPIICVIKSALPYITYGKIDFIPYAKPSDYDWSKQDVFNTFTGFIHQYEIDFQINHSKLTRFLDHIKIVWCNGHEELYEAVIKQFAMMLQQPNIKTQVCLVVLGREGLGKNRPIDLIRDYVMGKKYFAETCKMDKLTGRFNGAIENKLVGVLNEAANVGQAESHDNQERLKDMITNETVMIERKGIDPYTIADRCNYICFSNNYFVIKASTEMRRFVFLEASDKHLGDHQYFKDLSTDFELDGAGIHLYHYLMSIDISGFTPQRDFPTTELKEQLKAEALDKPTQWFIACVNKEVPTHYSIIDNDFNSVSTMLTRFNQWLDSRGDKSSWNAIRFGRSVSQLLGTTKLKYMDKVRTRGYDLTLDILREKLLSHTRRADLFEE